MLLSESRVVMASVLLSACGAFAATPLPAPGARAISVNFGSNHASLAGWRGVVGAYPVDAAYWMNIADAGNKGGTPTTVVSNTLTDNTGATIPSTSLMICSNGVSNYYNGSAASLIGRLMYGYLDDSSGNRVGIQINNVPYRNYGVILYFNTDQSAFPAFEFNGAWYKGDSAAQTTVAATGASETWGEKSTTELTEGCNYLVVTGFDTTTNPHLTITINNAALSGSRGTISGLQLIDTTPATLETYTATLSGDTAFSAIAWDGGKTWVNSPNAQVNLTFTGDATLTLDGALEMRTVGVNSPGRLRIKKTASSFICSGFDLSGIGALDLTDETIGWLPPLTAEPPVYLYTASAATIGTQVDTVTQLEAGTQNVPAEYAVTYAGGALNITGGVYSDFNAPATGTATTLTITGNPVINTGANRFDVGTMTVQIEGGTITTPKFHTTSGANSRPNTITQTGGHITLTDTGIATNSTTAAFILGHWNYGKSIYHFEGGSIQSAGGLRLGHDSQADLNISGGLLAVTDINGKGTQTTTLTLSGGELSIGNGGFAAFNSCTFTLAGGTLSASASNTIAQPVITAAGTTSILSAASGAIMKFGGTVSGSGALLIGSGTIEIPSATTVPVTVAAGAAIRVALTATEAATTGKVMGNVTLPEGQSIIFVNADGTVIADGTISGTTYTPASAGKVWNTTSGTWSVGDAPANWLDNAAFADGANVLFRDQPAPAAITVAGAVSPATLAIAGGNLTFSGDSITATAALAKTEAGTATFNQPVNPAKIQLDGGQLSFTSTLGNGGSFGSASQTLAIAKDTTLHLDIPTETTQVMSVANRSGSGTILKTGSGTLNLIGNNPTAFTGTVRVTEGTLLLNTGISSGPLYRNVIEVIGANSIIQLTAVNSVTWTGAAEPQRMILKEGASMQVQARNPINYKWEISDATIHVTGGEGSGTSARGLDFYNSPTLTVSAAEGATAEEPTVSRITGEADNQFSAASVRGGEATISVAENARLDIEIPVRNVDANRGFIKNGSGTLRFSGDNAYTGGTAINAGSVEVLNAGTLGKGAVSIAANATLKLDALEADQTLPNTVVSGAGTIEKRGDYASTFTCAVSNTLALATLEGTLAFSVPEGLNQELPLAKRSGEGTLVKNGPGELRLTGTKAGLGPIRATAGTLTIDYSGSQGPLYGNTIEATGEGTIIRLPKANSTAYDVTGDYQRLIAKDGATIRFENRCAVYANAWELCGGIIALDFASGDAYPRCLDFYYGPTVTIRAAEGATTANPTVSRVIDPNAKGGGLAIREGNATIDVAANARLEIEPPVTRYQANYGLTKLGSGTLLLANANNTYNGATVVEAGTFQLNGTHTGAGDYTIGEGAALAGTGTLILADGKSLIFEKASRFVKVSEAQEEALTLTGALILPEIETASDRIGVAFTPIATIKRGQPYYLIKTALPAGAETCFKAENPDLRIGQNATGLFIYQPAGTMITLY